MTGFRVEDDGEVVVFCFSGAPSLEDWHEFVAILLESLSRDGPRVFVYDVRQLRAFDVEVRKLLNTTQKEHRGLVERRSRGNAFVITDDGVRAAVRALYWFHAPPVETVTFDDVDEALAWARSRPR